MKLYYMILLSMIKLTKSSETCGDQLRMVNAKFISEEHLNTTVGVTNGELFLSDFLNHPRFVFQGETSFTACVYACLKYVYIFY